MSKVNEIIEEITSKIDESLSKDLDKDGAQKLLVDINNNLAEVEKNAEEKQQGIVKELREKINKSLSNEDGEGVIKTFLKTDIKTVSMN